MLNSKTILGEGNIVIKDGGRSKKLSSEEMINKGTYILKYLKATRDSYFL